MIQCHSPTAHTHTPPHGLAHLYRCRMRSSHDVARPFHSFISDPVRSIHFALCLSQVYKQTADKILNWKLFINDRKPRIRHTHIKPKWHPWVFIGLVRWFVFYPFFVRTTFETEQWKMEVCNMLYSNSFVAASCENVAFTANRERRCQTRVWWSCYSSVSYINKYKMLVVPIILLPSNDRFRA